MYSYNYKMKILDQPLNFIILKTISVEMHNFFYAGNFFGLLCNFIVILEPAEFLQACIYKVGQILNYMEEANACILFYQFTLQVYL